MLPSRCLFFLVALSLAVAAVRSAGAVTEPGVQRFSATLEQSHWNVQADGADCALTHEIPRFGVARFEQRAGHRLEFSLVARQPPVADQLAQLVSVAPEWKHGFSARNLGGVSLAAGPTPMRVPRGKALRIWYELEQGMVPTLIFDDWSDARDRVEVGLSPVRFRDALADFSACTGRLLHLDFEPVSEDRVYFDSDSAHLTPGARKALDKVALQVRKRQTLSVVLGGHTGGRGSESHNMALSRKRTETVAHYLRRRGVPQKRIETRIFGETQSGSDGAARAGNRRVTVWLAER